jgi:hypothetical protein
MQNEESLNLLNQKPGNVKNALVQKLSKQWPLSLKQLDHALKREFGMDVTYQAIHKAMQQLEEEKIVEKLKEGFQLHPEWITTITKLSNQISQAYADNVNLDPEKEIIQLKFNNWINAGRFVAFKFDLEYPNPENKPSICNWIHVWPVMGLSSEEVSILQNSFFKGTYYSACPNNTPVDKAVAKWLTNVGKICKTKIPILLDHDYMVKGDHVCQVHYPKEFIDEVNEFYRETESFNKMDFKRLTELMSKKINICVIIIKNKVLADNLREMTVKFFQNHPKKKVI